MKKHIIRPEIPEAEKAVIMEMAPKHIDERWWPPLKEILDQKEPTFDPFMFGAFCMTIFPFKKEVPKTWAGCSIIWEALRTEA